MTAQLDENECNIVEDEIAVGNGVLNLKHLS